MESAGLAAQAGGEGDQDILRTHALYIGGLPLMFSRAVLGRHARA
jgi:hypothetical protein